MFIQDISGIIYHGIGFIFKGTNCIEINYNLLPPQSPCPPTKRTKEKKRALVILILLVWSKKLQIILAYDYTGCCKCPLQALAANAELLYGIL